MLVRGHFTYLKQSSKNHQVFEVTGDAGVTGLLFFPRQLYPMPIRLILDYFPDNAEAGELEPLDVIRPDVEHGNLFKVKTERSTQNE